MGFPTTPKLAPQLHPFSTFGCQNYDKFVKNLIFPLGIIKLL